MTGTLWNSILHIGIDIFVGLVCIFLLNYGLKRFNDHLKMTGTSGENLKRMTTLIQAWRNIGHVVIILIVILMILPELGINIVPILASAGVVGLGLSLGAQTVVKDFLGGIVILTENQFGVGDVISIGQTGGEVERITLRATYLRDADGKLIIIPNGDIRTVSNLTTHWAQVFITFSFDYETNMDLAVKSLQEAVQLAQDDPEIKRAILDKPQVLGWTGFTDYAVQAQVLAKTKAGKQWAVARAIRKAALESLQKEGIHLALPVRRIENIG